MLLFVLPALLMGAGIVALSDDDDGGGASGSGTPPATVDPTVGTDGADTVIGAATNDIIQSASGQDAIYANDGRDIIDSAADDDRVFGGAGQDAIGGGAGDDFIRGGAQGDWLAGEAGDDTLRGDAGSDTLYGIDVLDSAGLQAAAEAAGQSGQVLSDAQIESYFDLNRASDDPDEADSLHAGVGADTIYAGTNDIVTTGDGADQVVLGDWVDASGNVIITDFAPASDTIVYQHASGTTAPTNFTFVDDGQNAQLQADGQTIAVLQGVQSADLESVTVSVLTYSTA